MRALGGHNILPMHFARHRNSSNLRYFPFCCRKKRFVTSDKCGAKKYSEREFVSSLVAIAIYAGCRCQWLDIWGKCVRANGRRSSPWMLPQHSVQCARFHSVGCTGATAIDIDSIPIDSSQQLSTCYEVRIGFRQRILIFLRWRLRGFSHLHQRQK